MTDNEKKFQSLMVWKETGILVTELVNKKGFSIAKTLHEIILAAHKRNFPDVYNHVHE